MQPRQQALLEQLGEPMTRLIATVANVAWIAVVVLGLITDDMVLAYTAWPAVVIAVFSMAQLLTRRPDVRAILIVTVATLAAAGLTMFDTRSAAPIVISLAAVGIALSLYIRQHLIAYIALYAAGMVAVVVWGNPDPMSGAISATTSAIVFAYTTYLVHQILAHSERETERFGSLFYHSPVALFEEDFTGVERFLDGLRATGVTDLAEYLRAQPEAALRIAGLIEITAANDAAVRLVEAKSVEAVLGQVHNRDVDSVDALTEQLLAVWRGDDHIVTEMPRAKTRQGHQRHLALWWAAPRIEGKPNYRHVSVAAVDVTESRETRRALEGLLRSKDELVATVSHELRTPLTTVVGLAAELSASIDDFDQSELRELVSLIASEGREVSTIVEDLLVASQVETGNLRLSPERVDLGQIATDVHRALPNQNAVSLYLPAEPVWVMADPMRTRQIVRNLVVNADRYGGSEVRICIAATPNSAALEVRDSGAPLPFRERDAIFDRYYRARQVPGLTASVGLGLTVSRQLARDMGGDLIYAHDGEEAIFELSLPRYIAAPQQLPARREAAG